MLFVDNQQAKIFVGNSTMEKFVGAYKYVYFALFYSFKDRVLLAI